MTYEENKTRLVCRILGYINRTPLDASILDNVAYCLADGSVMKACQHLWGSNPPEGINVSPVFAYTIKTKRIAP